MLTMTLTILQNTQFSENSILANLGTFKKYLSNIRLTKFRYKSFSPPSYDLSLIREDVTLLYGTGDLIADTVDVELLRDELLRYREEKKKGGKFADYQIRHIKMPKWGHTTINIGLFNRPTYLALANDLLKSYKQQQTNLKSEDSTAETDL